MKIKEYFYGRENIVLILLSLGVILLLIRDVPFLNIFFPDYTTLSFLFIVASFLFKWYKAISFYIILITVTALSFFANSSVVTEQLAILIFVILTINIVDQTIRLFKDEK